MMYEIINGYVYKILSYGKEYEGNENIITLTVDKNSIISDGLDKIIITASWNKFNIEIGKYELDIANNNPITFITPLGNIIDEDGILEFTSLEPGEYIFSAIYGLNTVKVVVI